MGEDDAFARATRETDGCDRTPAEEDRTATELRILTSGRIARSKDEDVKDDGVDVPATVQAGEEVTLVVTVTSQITSRGFANRRPAGEDSAPIETLTPECGLEEIGGEPDTPEIHRDRGRRRASRPRARRRSRKGEVRQWR